MVYFSEISKQDFRNIIIGLATWKKHPLEYNHAVKYVLEIRQVCEILDTKKFHSNTQYTSHKRFGEKVYKYKRNKNTIWNIIYNYDKENNIVYIEKIISSHLTISGIR